MKILKEGTEFSWRKILTALSAITFLIANLGYLLKWFPELPGTYVFVHTTIILSYFNKETTRKLIDKLKNKVTINGNKE